MRAREAGLRAALAVAAVAVGLIALELACRLWQGPRWLVHWSNPAAEPPQLRDDRSLYVHDAELGYVPRAGAATATFTVDADGFRRTATLAVAPSRPVLAMGDSFTEGYEVGDDESWPAYLQRLLERRVLNAGVSGYSLAQIKLRTERLVAAVHPAVVVVAFIADDLPRGALSRAWGHNLPWFEPVTTATGDIVAPRGVPVPPPPATTVSVWQRMLGWSMLAGVVADRLGGGEAWIDGVVREMPAAAAERTACPLMRRLAALGAPMLIVAQYDADMWGRDTTGAAEQRRIARLVLDCAEKSGLATLDLFDAVDTAVKQRGRDAIYRQWHHAPDGNRLVAAAIAEALRQRHLLP